MVYLLDIVCEKISKVLFFDVELHELVLGISREMHSQLPGLNFVLF